MRTIHVILPPLPLTPPPWIKDDPFMVSVWTTMVETETSYQRMAKRQRRTSWWTLATACLFAFSGSIGLLAGRYFGAGGNLLAAFAMVGSCLSARHCAASYERMSARYHRQRDDFARKTLQDLLGLTQRPSPPEESVAAAN